MREVPKYFLNNSWSHILDEGSSKTFFYTEFLILYLRTEKSFKILYLTRFLILPSEWEEEFQNQFLHEVWIPRESSQTFRYNFSKKNRAQRSAYSVQNTFEIINLDPKIDNC